MAAKINLGKLSDKELKALKQRIENELRNSRTRAIAAATQELQDAVQKIARKHGLTVRRSSGQEEKAAHVPCAGEVSEPERSEPDLVRTWTQAGVVPGGNGKWRVSREPGSLNSGIGRHFSGKAPWFSAKNPCDHGIAATRLSLGSGQLPEFLVSVEEVESGARNPDHLLSQDQVSVELRYSVPYWRPRSKLLEMFPRSGGIQFNLVKVKDCNNCCHGDRPLGAGGHNPSEEFHLLQSAENV